MSSGANDSFRLLMEERDKIMNDSLFGKPLDLTKLREISRDFDEIDSDGTDKELWSSVTQYFRDLLRS